MITQQLSQRDPYQSLSHSILTGSSVFFFGISAFGDWTGTGGTGGTARPSSLASAAILTVSFLLSLFLPDEVVGGAVWLPSLFFGSSARSRALSPASLVLSFSKLRNLDWCCLVSSSFSFSFLWGGGAGVVFAIITKGTVGMAAVVLALDSGGLVVVVVAVILALVGGGGLVAVGGLVAPAVVLERCRPADGMGGGGSAAAATLRRTLR